MEAPLEANLPRPFREKSECFQPDSKASLHPSTAKKSAALSGPRLSKNFPAYLEVIFTLPLVPSESLTM